MGDIPSGPYPGDAVLGPVDPTTGQYSGLYNNTDGNTSTPTFPVAGYGAQGWSGATSGPAVDNWQWLVMAALAALVIFQALDGGSKGRRRR